MRSEIESSILKLEKKIEMQNVEFQGYAEKFENRLIKGSIAFFISFGALVLTYLRFFGMPGQNSAAPAPLPPPVYAQPPVYAAPNPNNKPEEPPR